MIQKIQDGRWKMEELELDLEISIPILIEKYAILSSKILNISSIPTKENMTRTWRGTENRKQNNCRKVSNPITLLLEPSRKIKKFYKSAVF